MRGSRTPSEVASPHMEPLARLPVFFSLEGRRVIVAGGSAAAAWKAELLSAAGALVAVYTEDVSERMESLAALPPRGPVEINRRCWQASDFHHAAIAAGGFDSNDEAARFSAAARAAGVPVNVIDNPAFCDFSFGSIVNRSPLVIGISTDGAAPVFAQAIRAKLEAMIPQGFARWADAARRWRASVQTSDLTFAGRRRFWQLFTARAVRGPDQAPSHDDYADIMAAVRTEADRLEQGSVTLVGAGPGDPELLTLRAVRVLQSADVILFDDLVSREVLDFARREAKKMLVGKTGHGPSCTQEEINALMLALARGGKRVVRLKGGDPTIFGRAAEEIAACRGAGIAVEVVPGITAAQGAASRLGLSLTHRAKARRLQFVTGHGEDGRLPNDIDWRSLADPHAATIVYMPAKTIPELVERLLAAGVDPTMPVTAMARATRPDETAIATTLGALEAQIAADAPGGPLLLLIGRIFADATREQTVPRMRENG